MVNPDIERLKTAIRAKYGSDAVSLYGARENEEDGTAFKVQGIAATFSALAGVGEIAPGEYDIQVESVPPGDYLYTGVVRLEEFLELIDRFSGPAEAWPSR